MLTSKIFSREFFISLLLAVITSVFLVMVDRGGQLSRVVLLTNDLHFKLRGGLPSAQDLIIIEIADSDVAKIGRWPWKRSWHAAMTKVLTELGASSVYFDIIFSEPSTDEDDYLFQQSIIQSGRVYLPYVFVQKPYNIEEGLLPIKRFSDNIVGMGAMNVYPDSDGAIRDMPILFIGDSGTFPHISLKIAMDRLGLEIGEITDEYVEFSGEERNVRIPISEGNLLTINWTGKWVDTFRHYGFIDVLAAYQDQLEGKPTDIHLDDFKNAICLVGITGFGLYDIKPVPLEPEYPGIGIIANAIHTLLTCDFIDNVPYSVNAACLILLTLIPAFIIHGDKPFRETAIVLLVAVIFFVVSHFLFLKGICLDLFFPIFGLIVGFMVVGTYNFIRTAVEKQSLFSISITDGLTGLCNIRYFKILLESELKMAQTGMNNGFVVILSDIDHFKNFNDTYGHQVGDDVLKAVSNSLKDSVRASDIVGRYGGEEMIILLKSTGLEEGMGIAEKIRSNVEMNKVKGVKEDYSVTASFGVASFMQGDTIDTIIKRSDEGLYLGKEEGRNCVRTVELFRPSK